MDRTNQVNIVGDIIGTGADTAQREETTDDNGDCRPISSITEFMASGGGEDAEMAEEQADEPAPKPKDSSPFAAFLSQ